MTFDEEELDPHGECRHEIARLRNALRGMVGLIQLVERRPDMPTAIYEALTTSHRYHEAQECIGIER